MLATKRIILVLAWGTLAISCDNPRIGSPSPVPGPAPAQPAPTPSAPAEVWNLSVRMTAVNGYACVAETLRAQIDMANSYTLAMTPRGSDAADVRLSSKAGDLSCTFTVVVTTADGFTTFGQPRRFSCGEYGVQCADGTYHPLFAAGWDISGQISGNAITGKWAVNWWDIPDATNDVDVMSEFRGSR